MLTYAERAQRCVNPTAKKLLQLMETKQTNLAVAADVTQGQALLQLAQKIGPEICVLKTHVDILTDFSVELITQLKQLAHEQQFLLFEDRKFADIGNTVNLQYAQGIYRICEWANITNAHSTPGPGIIEGLKIAGLARGNGLLLLAEMSSAGNLMNDHYQQQTLTMAKTHVDFVIGFITQHQLSPDPNFINFTPGIHLQADNDQLGQQYTTPATAIIERGTDVIIVGRGIYQADDPQTAAKYYRASGWEAYLQRLRN